MILICRPFFRPLVCPSHNLGDFMFSPKPHSPDWGFLYLPPNPVARCSAREPIGRGGGGGAGVRPESGAPPPRPGYAGGGPSFLGSFALPPRYPRPRVRDGGAGHIFWGPLPPPSTIPPTLGGWVTAGPPPPGGTPGVWLFLNRLMVKSNLGGDEADTTQGNSKFIGQSRGMVSRPQ